MRDSEWDERRVWEGRGEGGDEKTWITKTAIMKLRKNDQIKKHEEAAMMMYRC